MVKNGESTVDRNIDFVYKNDSEYQSFEGKMDRLW